MARFGAVADVVSAVVIQSVGTDGVGRMSGTVREGQEVVRVLGCRCAMGRLRASNGAVWPLLPSIASERQRGMRRRHRRLLRAPDALADRRLEGDVPVLGGLRLQTVLGDV